MTIPIDHNGSVTALDTEAIEAKNREEREKRLNKKGLTQFREAKGELARFATDPWATASGDRPPVDEDVDVLIVGCGFGGILAAKKLHDAGVHSIRMIDQASDFGGVWYWNRLDLARSPPEPILKLTLSADIRACTATLKRISTFLSWKRPATFLAPNTFREKRSRPML
jgi:hypothetical protein